MRGLNIKLWLAYAGCLAIAFAAGFIAHWRIAGNAQAKADFKHYQNEVEKVVQATDKLEVKNEKREAKYKQHIKTIVKYVDRPIYRSNVCIDDDGLRIINAALTRTDTAKPN